VNLYVELAGCLVRRTNYSRGLTDL